MKRKYFSVKLQNGMVVESKRADKLFKSLGRDLKPIKLDADRDEKEFMQKVMKGGKG